MARNRAHEFIEDIMLRIKLVSILRRVHIRDPCIHIIFTIAIQFEILAIVHGAVGKHA